MASSLIKRNNSLIIFSMLDIAAIIAAFYVTILANSEIEVSFSQSIRNKLEPLFVYLAIWTLISIHLRVKIPSLRNIPFFFKAKDIIFKSVTALIFSFFFTYYLFDILIPRKVFIYFIVTQTIFILSYRYFFTKLIRHLWGKGFFIKNILLVGANKRSHQIFEKIKTQSHSGFKVIGVVDNNSNYKQPGWSFDILGDFKDMETILTKYVVDIVIIALPIKSFYNEIRTIVDLCEQKGTICKIPLSIFNLTLAKQSVMLLDDISFLSIITVPFGDMRLVVKKIIDLTVCSLILLLFFPFGIIISLIIKLTSKGPIFFTQKRVGQNQRIFSIYKFRTMIENAEELKHSLEKENESEGPTFKIKYDPRVTTIGRFLRKYHIDESPQFVNVLKGNMSLVGPRPPLPYEVNKYDWSQRRRLSMPPGLTCLWQIQSNKHSLNFKKWVALDLQYIDNWSLTLDFYILFKTCLVMFKGQGQ